MARSSSFPGLPHEFLTFFRALERNNDRDWFRQRKEVYERAVKGPMLELIEALNQELFRCAPEYITDPKRSLYRIYRDTRFSADKTPYKTHAGALFTRHGFDKNFGAALYCGISRKEVEVAGGVYMPGPDELRAVRLHLASHHEEFRRLISDRKLVAALGPMQGEQLSRAPKGFAPDHPASDLVRYKQFLFDATLEPGLITTPRLLPEIAVRFKLMAPVVEFLNAAHRARRALTASEPGHTHTL